jgi:signal transduction histidine kinase
MVTLVISRRKSDGESRFIFRLSNTMLRSDIAPVFGAAGTMATSQLTTAGPTAMGMRHRSIGLRVGLLIAVPMLSLVVLYAFVVSLTLSNALTQTRSTSVRNDVGNPLGVFQLQVAAERGLAVLSLATQSSMPVASELATQETATSRSLAQLQAAFSSSAVTSGASAAELTAIHAVLAQGAELSRIRGAVAGHAIAMGTALADYDSIIQSGYVVLDRIFYAEANVQQVTQAIDLVNLDRARQATVAERDLLAGDIAMRQFPGADRLTIASLAATRQQLMISSLAALQPSYRAAIDRYLTAPVRSALVTADATVADTPWHHGAAPSSVVSASNALGAYPTALEPALLTVATQIQQASQHQGNIVLLQLILAGGLGLMALITTIALSLVLGRGLVRQLRELRGSALTLAQDELPSVIDRLRSGEAVDLDQYAPGQPSTRNEIEQVRQAVGVLHHAALQAAADEARVRRGINDVFRNLAGRSQSLLHRQLTLIDTMERRATDSDELENLFRIDHLTTRMRRHAEGLIILSGDTPARGWRRPVPLVDVLRAAVAEVEDYTRIRVQCRTSGAVAGHAVADIVHLVAELAENATVFSPPNTPVRIQGESVGQGYAIEIEDRGLGISRARLEEINENLANPPQFDLSGSDRLGLFIAGQLARRHDITVTLRPSVYGGTTAIVLLPMAIAADVEPIVPDRILPARREDQLVFDRRSGRHAALTAPPAGNGHRSPSGDPGNEIRSGGFIFGQVTPPDNGAADEPLRRLTGSGEAFGETAPEAAGPTVAELTELGLPIRVRQASLAPQLRDTPAEATTEPEAVEGGFTLPRRRTSAADFVAPAAARITEPGPATPEAARNVVSALQRGWQLGRTEPVEPMVEEIRDETDENQAGSS